MSRADKTPSVARNLGALFGAHAAGVVAPLLTVPYLARVLRPEGWAPVIVAQALANWMALVLEFGFDLSGTRSVARARAEPAALTRVVGAVQGAKLVLVLPTTVVFAVAIAFLPPLRANPLLATFALATAVLRGLNPLWYFQGVERMGWAVAVDSGTSILAAASVYLAVHDPHDGWRVLLLQATFAAVSLTVLTRALLRDVPIASIDVRGAVAMLRESRHVFGFRMAGGLFVQANSVILTLLAAPAAVAFFGGAERIIRAAINLYLPVTRAVFPRVSYLTAADPASARHGIPRLIGLMTVAGTVLGASAWFGAPLLVRILLGPEYVESVHLLRVLSPLPIILGISTALGVWWALPFGHERGLLRIVVVAGVLNAILAALLVPRWSGAGMAVSVITAELVVAVSLTVLYAAKR